MSETPYAGDTAAPLVVEVRAEGDPADVVVALTGEVDQLNADEVVARTEPWIRSGVSSITLDLAGVVFIDSGGIGRVITLWKRGRAIGLPVRLTAAHEAVLGLLELAGLGRFMDISVVPARTSPPSETEPRVRPAADTGPPTR